MKALNWLAILLLVIGGLNWLLVGAFEIDLVATIFGEMTPVARAVYIAVGIAAIYVLFLAPRLNRDERTAIHESRA